jgi:NAD(P)-dependent dehydrogenase (short-subunit alcohol dehydrogenase family)
MDINGLRAMIVGGASGMARATAERIVAGGGKVAILDQEKSAGVEVAAAMGASFHPCNVLDFEGIELVIQEAVDALGGLHAMVNTAGGGVAMRTLSKEGPHPLDAFRQACRSRWPAISAAWAFG